MQKIRRRFPRLAPALALAVLGVLLVLGCQSKAPPPWPWWTDEDRTEVNNELTAWRDSISTRMFLEATVETLNDSTTIIARDSISPTGAELVKIVRLLGFGTRADGAARRDSLSFGVTVDSLYTDTSWSDTFCHVIAVDSTYTGFGTLRCDRYWVIKYRPDTTVDTTALPWDTTVTWRLDGGARAPVLHQDSTFEFEKGMTWLVNRYLYLRKENTKPLYHLRRMSGFSLYLPNTTDAPSLRYLALTYQGIADTFKLNADSTLHGVNNLRSPDSAYTVRKGEVVNLMLQTDKPKLKGDKFYYIARLENQRVLLGTDTLTVSKPITFANAGLHHLLVEIVPQSNLFYPGSEFAVTIWSLPIRVKD
jgi:hypothetical protein